MSAAVGGPLPDCMAYGDAMDALHTGHLETTDRETCTDDDSCHAAANTNWSLNPASMPSD